MWEDPIVSEVHQTRKKLAAQYLYDISAYFADIRKRQAALGEKLLPQKKRVEQTAEADRGPEPGTPESKPLNAAPGAGGAEQEVGVELVLE